MSNALPPKPRVVAPRGHIAVIASKYNEKYTDALVMNTVDELGDLMPSSRVDIIRVPGAFEIPVTIEQTLRNGDYSCVIALGVILRGSTDHADIVAQSVGHALQTIAITHAIPVIHEVLLLENEEQAEERCVQPQLNRGREAARTAATISQVFHEINRTAARNK